MLRVNNLVGFGVGRLWTPANTTTAIWLDADDASTLTNTSGLCEEWRDKSGNGRNFGETNASLRPPITAAAVNGRTALVWPNGTNNKRLSGSTSFAVSDWFMVMRYQDGTPTTWRTDYPAMIVNTGGNRRLLGDLIGTTGSFTEVFIRLRKNGNAEIADFRFGGADSLLPIPLGLTYVTRVTSENTQWAFGNDWNAGTRGWNGPVCELIGLAANPTTAVRELFEGYLAHKWGFSAFLPSTHPYKNAPPRIGQLKG
jgi:hypothetical protein